MAKPIIFLPEALGEDRDAYTWYEGREAGLGEDFFRALSGALTYAARNPDTLVRSTEITAGCCSAGFHTLSLTGTLRTLFTFTRYSTALKTPRSG
jgi:hypothetical protein